MTNEELKKKIESIIRNAKRDFAYCVPEEWAVKVLADALIAAKIGDVKDLQVQVDSLEITNIALQAGYDDAENDRLYWVNKYKEAEHRAEVVQLVAKRACDIVFSQELDSEDWDEVIFNYKKEKGIREIGITPNILYDYLKEQAEKELAEEGKE